MAKFTDSRYAGLIVALFIYSNCAGAEIATGKAKPNALYHHASPYLAMHGRDPVQWQEWNAATVASAVKQNKLLFVSSGYFSCHWCHVMQRESYQNTEIARLLNQYFIPVKVDRELNSALDARLIDFVERTQGYSGWPLNVFVTPEGYPLVGLVYLPPDSFRELLTKITDEWKKNDGDMKQLARAASDELSRTKPSDSYVLPKTLRKDVTDTFLKQVFASADELQGGFGQQNKFPSVPQLDVLLDLYKLDPDEKLKGFLVLTLKQMARSGLRDQLGGGFYRYTVDPGWQVPHFEKMLYDNALLSSLYYKAGIIFQDAMYTEIANNTLDFMLRELITGSGAMQASLSAIDGNGVEGGYYLWHRDELIKVLTKEEWQLVSMYWHLDGPPDLDHGQHLVTTKTLEEVSKKLGMKPGRARAVLESARHKLLLERGKRKLPVDTKMITAWNGLALSALIDGAREGQHPEYRAAASRLVAVIQKRIWNGQKLSRLLNANGGIGDGYLEDYAYISQALYDWWLLTKSAETKQVLEKILQQAWKRFYGKEGWILAEDMLLRYGQGEAIVADGPMPSPSAILVNVTYQYAIKTSNEGFRRQALRAINSCVAELNDSPFWFATQIKGIIGLPG